MSDFNYCEVCSNKSKEKCDNCFRDPLHNNLLPSNFERKGKSDFIVKETIGIAYYNPDVTKICITRNSPWYDEMHDRAVECAHDNYILSSKIDAYWFPDEDELRMVLLDKTAIPDDGHGKILPFYFSFENKVEAMASILPEEFGKLNVPDGWCDWSEAIHIKE